MRISVHGSRAGIRDWEQVRDLPVDQLPPLTPDQQAVAAQLGIPEEEYARSALAGQRTQEKLLAKTEQFARLLEKKVRERNPQANIDHVALLTWEQKFEVEIRIDGRPIPLRVNEDVVDDLLEGGSDYADQKLTRIVDAIVVQGAA